MKIVTLLAISNLLIYNCLFGQMDRGVLTTNNNYKKTKDKLALVIGNADYPGNKKLTNPINDADSISKYLKRLKFDVLEYKNLDVTRMRTAISNFIIRLKEYKTGLFFFAGHGSERNGENFLYPLDANPESAADMEKDCIQLNQLLNGMASSQTDANLIILDACRTNPFRDWPANDEKNQIQNGLAKVDAPPNGTLICFASSPGQPAADGIGSNGVYTQCLIKNIEKANISINDMFANVNRDVRKITNGKQIPYINSSLDNALFLNDKPDMSGGVLPAKKESVFNLETLNGTSYEASTTTDFLTFIVLPNNKISFSGSIGDYQVSGKLKRLNSRTFQVIEGNATGNLSFNEDYQLITGIFTIKKSQLVDNFNLAKKD